MCKGETLQLSSFKGSSPAGSMKNQIRSSNSQHSCSSVSTVGSTFQQRARFASAQEKKTALKGFVQLVVENHALYRLDTKRNIHKSVSISP